MKLLLLILSVVTGGTLPAIAHAESEDWHVAYETRARQRTFVLFERASGGELCQYLWERKDPNQAVPSEHELALKASCGPGPARDGRRQDPILVTDGLARDAGVSVLAGKTLERGSLVELELEGSSKYASSTVRDGSFVVAYRGPRAKSVSIFDRQRRLIAYCEVEWGPGSFPFELNCSPPRSLERAPASSPRKV